MYLPPTDFWQLSKFPSHPWIEQYEHATANILHCSFSGLSLRSCGETNLPSIGLVYPWYLNGYWLWCIIFLHTKFSCYVKRNEPCYDDIFENLSNIIQIINANDAMVQIFSWGERWNVPFNEAKMEHFIFHRTKMFVPLHEWQTFISCFI